ncbi:hypothetical protein CerSpe_071170 [Prunus speciosa]
MKILVKEQILPSLTFGDDEICIECVKGKLTKTKKKGVTRSNDLLEIIHTDICGPFPHQTIDGNRYFITFIDDHSHFGYLYLIVEKSQAFEMFKIFQTEVERQLEKKIKIVRLDRGGEYYGRFDEGGQRAGPFARYLQDNGIVAQYTTPRTPQQNGVAERRNRTLKDMVRSMISKIDLPKSLWGEAIKTANYILNRVPSKSVPSKSVPKTPFETWTTRKPSLRHLHVWGCKAEARIYNPKEKKLDPKTISCHFIGYLSRSKGFRFYCSNYGTRIVETGCAKFIEHEENAIENEDFIFEEEGDVAVIENAELDVTPLIPLSETVLENPQFEEPVDPQEQAVENPELDNPQEPVQPRRSDRPRRSTSNSNYVYLQEADFDIGDEANPTSFKEAMESQNADKWREAMLNELESMKNNQVWELVEPQKSQKLVGSKWVFKTKKDKDGRIERFKARLVAKGFTQRGGN